MLPIDPVTRRVGYRGVGFADIPGLSIHERVQNADMGSGLLCAKME